MATKKSGPRKSSVSKRKKTTKAPQYVSFRRSPNVPFVNFTPTIQTVYWVVIGAVVLALGIYIIFLQMRINQIYDHVDMNSTDLELNDQDMQKLHKSSSNHS